MAEKKEKQYVSDNAQLMAEWDWDKNTALCLDPQNISSGSGIKAWWKCCKGHEWQAIVDNRNKGRGCPYCSGRYAIKGENDLQTVNPTLAREWNHEKNTQLTPADVLPNSNKKVWWMCGYGHEWQATIADRNNGKGCPYCAGHRVVKGYTDLQTVNPALATEWNYEKNAGLTPTDVMPNSGRKVWWKCNKGHEWQSTIDNRNNGNGCPICSSEYHTSFPEYAIIYYLRKYGLEVIHTFKGNGYELDVYIPSKMVALEYDGYYWHKNRTSKDLEKNRRCRRDRIKLYRIREGLLPLDDSSIDYVVRKDQKDLHLVLQKVLSEIIESSIDVDLTRDSIAIENMRQYADKQKSLLFSNPEIAKEWHCEKNGKLKPEHFTANSEKRVWWKCTVGHEWQATISHRNSGNGCPYCSGQKVLVGYNDLLTVK